MSHPPSIPLSPAQTKPLSILHHGQKKCQGETEEEDYMDYMVDYSDISGMTRDKILTVGCVIPHRGYLSQ